MNTEKLFSELGTIAKQNNTELFIVGGFIRDRILSRTSKDIDFVVIGDGIAFAKKVKKALQVQNFAVYKRFGTAKLSYKGYDLEFVGARSESYERSSRKPFVEEADLETDLSRRDFTINAIALPIDSKNEFIDPLNGQDDIRNKIIRTALDADITFSDDPLRMLRAVRFASRFLYQIEEKTAIGIQKNIFRLDIVSKERIMDELKKCLASEHADYAITLLCDFKLFDFIFPLFLDAKADILAFFQAKKYQTLSLVQRFAVLVHYASLKKDEIEVVFHDLKFSNDFIKAILYIREGEAHIQKLISDGITQDRSKAFFLYNCGNSYKEILQFYSVLGFPFDLERLSSALSDYDQNNRFSNFKLSINGNDIKARLGEVEGVRIGYILKSLTQKVLMKEIQNKRELLLEDLSSF